MKTLEELKRDVHAAIQRTAGCLLGAPEFLAVSVIWEAIAKITEPRTVDGTTARFEAVTKAIDAEKPHRVVMLCVRYLTEDLPEGLAADLRHYMKGKP